MDMVGNVNNAVFVSVSCIFDLNYGKKLMLEKEIIESYLLLFGW